MDKVLIAEDSKSLLMYLTKVLGKYSDKFEVIPVNDGEEAIVVLKEQPISLLITDIQMPKVNGLELLSYVNTHHSYIPCFVMTAFGTSRLKAKLPKDILRFFSKPISVKDLARAILAVLDRNPEQVSLQGGISMVKFLYMIEMDNGSCTFEITSPDRGSGEMYFDKGILIGAEYQNIIGEAAALEMISWESTTFHFKPLTEKKITRRIKTDYKELINNVFGTIEKPEEL